MNVRPSCARAAETANNNASSGRTMGCRRCGASSHPRFRKPPLWTRHVSRRVARPERACARADRHTPFGPAPRKSSGRMPLLRTYYITSPRRPATDAMDNSDEGACTRPGQRPQSWGLVGDIMLDILVVSPHPDDAELGMGGAILKFRAEGLAVGVLDLTDGEPTPLRLAGNPPPGNGRGDQDPGLDWRENLGLPNRSLEPTLAARRQLAGVFRQHAAAVDFRPLLDRRPSRPRGRHATGRGRPLLVEAHQDRHARRAVLSRADLLLLLLPPADHPAAGLRAGHQRLLGAEAGGDRVLPQPVHRRPAARAAHLHRPRSATRPPPGAGRSASATASPSPAASRSGWGR